MALLHLSPMIWIFTFFLGGGVGGWVCAVSYNWQLNQKRLVKPDTLPSMHSNLGVVCYKNLKAILSSILYYFHKFRHLQTGFVYENDWSIVTVKSTPFLSKSGSDQEIHECCSFLVNQTKIGPNIVLMLATSGVGVTKASLIDFSVSKIFDLAKLLVEFI